MTASRRIGTLVIPSFVNTHYSDILYRKPKKCVQEIVFLLDIFCRLIIIIIVCDAPMLLFENYNYVDTHELLSNLNIHIANTVIT